MTARPLTPVAISAPAVPRGRVPWTFGPATVRLLLCGFLFLLPAWFDRRLIAVMGLWDAAVLAAWAIDLRRLPPPGALTVTRAWASPPALGLRQEIAVTIANESRVAVAVFVSDFVSPLLRAAPPELTAVVPAGGVARVGYEVTPRSRGDLELSFAALRYRTASDLAERWATAPLSQTIRIYPDMGEAARERMALVRARQIAMEKRRARTFGFG